mgnify:CR=1 FL=1
MRRKCTDSLIYWKKNPGRKPLILQGLRQTGKTWLLMDFGNKQYEHTLYINLETDRSAADRKYCFFWKPVQENHCALPLPF